MRFEGHRGRLERLSLGAYEETHYGRISDHFAYAYGFTIIEGDHTVIGPKQVIGFHDDRPDCRNVVMSDNAIFYFAENTVYRFKDAEGKLGGEQLLISVDGGKTFSQNLFPGALNSLHDPNEVAEHRIAINNFGYHRGRINSDGQRLQLELTNPLDYQQFLYFESTDLGRHWQRGITSNLPRVYSQLEVEKWRELFARNRWLDQRFKAAQQACLNAIEQACALKTENAWDAAIKPCLDRANWQLCVKEFVVPEVSH
ncbi:hypothetical protein H8K35_01390 [Undibacterium sp. LX40W]|uniref:Uncharacterized protein n=1 Tax=Undibacterium nitidum TaxID=2762298 RepID=A0A923KKN0_9BURK|nr:MULTISPECIES: hypothetical protein [Undibacterium]MBC3880965.1 hypothetical protein [Undibacterium nitidum]MBC3890302.1 hypothetical protein [Undibacterium sp. LX40W]